MASIQAVNGFRGRSGAGGWRKAVIVTTLTLATVLLAYWMLHAAGNHSKAAVARHSFGMSVSGTGQDLKLSWNPRAPEVQTAVKGHLIIRDGDQLTVRTLGPRELSAGSSRYTSTGSSVIFELKLLQPDQAAMVETLRYENSNASSPPDTELPEAGTQTADAGNPTRAHRFSPRYETQFADRQRESRLPGTVIVHGVVARDTPIDVRVSRESLEYAQQRDRGKTGFLHHIKSWSKKPAMLWPFRRNPDGR